MLSGIEYKCEKLQVAEKNTLRAVEKHNELKYSKELTHLKK